MYQRKYNSPKFTKFHRFSFKFDPVTMATDMKMKEWYMIYVFWYENKQTWKVSLKSETMRERLGSIVGVKVY